VAPLVQNSAGMKLSVVIPVYNEALTIREIVDRVRKVAVDKEIIIVDDYSTDGTRDVLAHIESQFPDVTVRFHERNYGKGRALRTGFTAARGDYVIVQDADLEYDPEDYAKLIRPLDRGLADAVYGSRFLSTEEHRVLYFWHSMGNRFLTLLSNMVTDLNLTDMETCYKVFRRELIQSIPLEEDRFGFEPEVTCKLAKAGARMYEVGIAYHGRTYEEGKKIGMKDGFRALWCILKYSSKPLKLKQPAAAAKPQAAAE
jgi:glycosyltransferase involved in cell wall biosynthesis